MIDTPNGYTISGKTYRNLAAQVAWLTANMEELIASGSALPAPTYADLGKIMEVIENPDEAGTYIWSMTGRLNTINNTVNGLSNSVSDLQYDVNDLDRRLDAIDEDLDSLADILADIVDGEVQDE